MRRALRAAALLGLALTGAGCATDSTTIHVGPPSVGTGGSNPVSIPPLNPLEYELELVYKSGLEVDLALTPGIILVGHRSTMASGLYVAAGGGVIRSANGAGPGAFTSFGINLGGKYQFNAEYKQTLGWDFGRQQMLSPYAVRVGLTIQH